jgi:hypothetical protein
MGPTRLHSSAVCWPMRARRLMSAEMRPRQFKPYYHPLLAQMGSLLERFGR